MQTVNTQPILPEYKATALRRLSSQLASVDTAAPLVAGAAGLALGSLIASSLRPKKHRKLFKARFASATAARSLGAMVTGAFAIGATATGALAIGALAIGKLKIRDLDIERLRVGSVVEGALPLRPAAV